MNLDKQIKEMAKNQVDTIIDAGARALAQSVGSAPLSVPDVARLVSEHKTKSTYDKCVKIVADSISVEMLKTVGTSGSDASVAD